MSEPLRSITDVLPKQLLWVGSVGIGRGEDGILWMETADGEGTQIKGAAAEELEQLLYLFFKVYF